MAIYGAKGAKAQASLEALDAEEARVFEVFQLAAFGDGFGGIRHDYHCAADYCDRYALDRVEVWRAIVSMGAAYNGAAKERKSGKGKR